jgi:hypothetical protein
LIKGENVKKIFGSIIIVLLLVTVLATATLAAPAAGARELLLKGTVQATETQNLVPPNNYINLNGSGNATQLGLFTYSLQATLYLPTLTAKNTKATFVAADGSTLSTEGTGKGEFTDTPGIVSIVETLTITGGTGRFEGASGNITIQRLVNRATLTSSGTIDGLIVLP